MNKYPQITMVPGKIDLFKWEGKWLQIEYENIIYHLDYVIRQEFMRILKIKDVHLMDLYPHADSLIYVRLLSLRKMILVLYEQRHNIRYVKIIQSMNSTQFRLLHTTNRVAESKRWSQNNPVMATLVAVVFFFLMLIFGKSMTGT